MPIIDYLSFLIFLKIKDNLNLKKILNQVIKILIYYCNKNQLLKKKNNPKIQKYKNYKQIKNII